MSSPMTLIDGAFVAVHRGHHALDNRVKNRPCVFRIAVGQQLHGAFKVGKQHRDLLALAFESWTRGEDFLG
jgi:hypothetical protein